MSWLIRVNCSTYKVRCWKEARTPCVVLVRNQSKWWCKSLQWRSMRNERHDALVLMMWPVEMVIVLNHKTQHSLGNNEYCWGWFKTEHKTGKKHLCHHMYQYHMLNFFLCFQASWEETQRWCNCVTNPSITSKAKPLQAKTVNVLAAPSKAVSVKFADFGDLYSRQSMTGKKIKKTCWLEQHFSARFWTSFCKMFQQGMSSSQTTSRILKGPTLYLFYFSSLTPRERPGTIYYQKYSVELTKAAYLTRCLHPLAKAKKVLVSC